MNFTEGKGEKADRRYGFLNCQRVLQLASSSENFLSNVGIATPPPPSKYFEGIILSNVGKKIALSAHIIFRVKAFLLKRNQMGDLIRDTYLLSILHNRLIEFARSNTDRRASGSQLTHNAWGGGILVSDTS